MRIFHIGDFRIIYMILENQTVLILQIGQRKCV
ncbi:MAG: type II toxin-antitoxin system RelE/ParE family toxin [Melioribacteraceae bacterium]|nr:type II toxin-antitoxin system RelE/ParE family toxin [Melioribacteraceae bacterium]MCF8263103.1 type II toxin-antitoxin system RelE/ParE family toxin [Melioribacteraceae bacterium]MCF8430565.1 type II toxin-antitoxin system RelE/ParE family toxin [Melioribacteraceae bacterium]